MDVAVWVSVFVFVLVLISLLTSVVRLCFGIEQQLQPGIPPRMMARLVTRDHAEFRSKKQQDALEFLHYFLDQIQRQVGSPSSVSPPLYISYI